MKMIYMMNTRRRILGVLGGTGTVASLVLGCGPSMTVGLLGLAGADIGAVLAQQLLLLSLGLLIITSWSKGHLVFGLTVLLSVAAFLFRYVLVSSVLSWSALGLLSILLLGTTMQRWYMMRNRQQTVAPADSVQQLHMAEPMVNQ